MGQSSPHRWMRRVLAVGLFFAAGIAGAGEAFVIVSDVDDTVKITNVRRPVRAAINAVKSELAFAGMSELYRQLLGPASTNERLRFISGSSRVLDKEVAEVLVAAAFPAYGLTLRRVRESFMSAFDYKNKHMNLLYGTAQGRFILIGDDTEADPEVYAAFARKKPGQVLAIYIRRVTGRPLPSGSTPFVTAYDIAVQEFEAGRLTQDQAAAVGRVVRDASARTLLPSFHACPVESNATTIPADSFRSEIEARIHEICVARTH